MHLRTTLTALALASMVIVPPQLAQAAEATGHRLAPSHQHGHGRVTAQAERDFSRKGLLKLAIWPVYFYGCDDDDQDPDCF